MTLFHSQLKIGTTLANRYSILAQLGEGGMGAVFLANDLKLSGKQWAIKESRLHVDQAQSFADEAAILIKLDHPFLPHIVDFFPPDLNGFSYLVMDYIKGQSLQKLFEARKAISIEQAVHYAKQLCQVFDYLHHYKPKAIIYRDLKPSNVMIDEQDNIRLIDFGIARNYTFERHSDTVQLGTIGFAAPEQYEHQQTDARTDLYTLGALLFYLLNKGQHYSFHPGQIQQMHQQLPEKLAKIITRLLKLVPEERYQTASQVLQELELVLDDKTDRTKSYPQPGMDRPSSPRKLILVGSLYPGAGSTFVAVAIARVLNHFAVPHALVENICNEPALFTLFFGERNAPQGYKFAADKVYYETTVHTPAWQNGYSELFPLPPDGFMQVWNSALNYKLLYSIPESIIVMDVSHHWEDQTVIDLCRHADEVVVVAGPSLSHLNAPSTYKHINSLIHLQKEGKSIQCVANRAIPFAAQNEWLATLPFHPTCTLPEFNYADVLQAEWGGKLFVNQEAPLKRCIEKLMPLLTKVIPNDYLSPVKPLKKHAFHRWFK
ncbi:MAG: serine/threonine-protein kinase [Paenibacillaceae bacterium]